VEPVALDEAAAWVSPASGNHPVHALLEAAASGVPIIATASPEVTTHFSTDEALIVPRRNPVALAHALADLAANPAAAARRAARARFRVESTGVDAPLRWQAGLEAMLVAPR
jgi:glycosyltransferase involved in cell wall biosynthesis